MSRTVHNVVLARRLWPWVALALLVAVALVPDDAWARIGGGQSYGRSGRSSGGYSGGGGGGDGVPIELIYLLFRLVIEYPALGVPLLIVFVGFLVLRGMAGGLGERQVHRTHHHPVYAATAPTRRATSTPGLAALRQVDPALSLPVLTDFLVLVHRRAHEAIGSSAWGPLAPFVADSARQQLVAAHPTVSAVREGVVGGVRLLRVDQRGGYHLLHARFEATQLELLGKDGERRVLVEEDWVFRRAVGARSLSPEAVERLGCPNCGAAFETTPMGACPNCGTPITAGQLQWQAISVQLLSRRVAPPPEVAVGPGGEESSVHVPTVYAPDLPARLRELTARHPDLDLRAFERRVADIYGELQRAWSDGRWEAIRPWVTDPMYQTLRFWIERYTRAGLRNQLTDIRLSRQEIVRVDLDPWYEAITVRIWGSMKDAVVDRSGRVVGGNATQDRAFSEYWTFLRAVGSGGEVHDATRCPSCGAPADQINQAGVCGYCGSKITTGRFDWVLSRIDQPEGYGG